MTQWTLNMNGDKTFLWRLECHINLLCTLFSLGIQFRDIRKIFQKADIC